MKKFLAFALFLPVLVSAFERDPWLHEPYEFYWNNRIAADAFHRIDTATGPTLYSTTNESLQSTLGFVFLTPIDVQVQLRGVHTKEQHANLEEGAIQVRYQILDDIGEDLLSLTCGAEVAFPLRQSLADINLVHHAPIEAMIHLAAGKEWACGPHWVWRAWALAALGAGTQRSGFGYTKIQFEWARCHHQWFCGVEGRMGFGGQDLVIDDFFTYGSIAYRWVDVIAGYRYEWFPWGIWSVEIKHRFVSDNVPIEVTSCSIGFELPFGV